MIPEASHQPILFEVIKNTKGSILELGAGESSTRQIHKLAKGREILTIDDNQEWAFMYSGLKENHRFIYLKPSELYNYFKDDKNNWSVVLVDLSTSDERMIAIQNYSITSDYVIVHDSQSLNVAQFFKYWRQFSIKDHSDYPQTLLGSNYNDVSRFNIKGVIDYIR